MKHRNLNLPSVLHHFSPLLPLTGILCKNTSNWTHSFPSLPSKKPFHPSSLNPVNAFSPFNPSILLSIHPYGLSVANCLVWPPAACFVLPPACILCSYLPVSVYVLIVVVVNNLCLALCFNFFLSPLTPYVTNALLCLTCLLFFLLYAVLLWLCNVVLFNQIFLP